jgi:hypothetical protein
MIQNTSQKAHHHTRFNTAKQITTIDYKLNKKQQEHIHIRKQNITFHNCLE